MLIVLPRSIRSRARKGGFAAEKQCLGTWHGRCMPGIQFSFTAHALHLPRCSGRLSCFLRIHPKQYFTSPFQVHDPVVGTEGKPRINICRSYLCGPHRLPGARRTTFRCSLIATQFACLAGFLLAVSSAYKHSLLDLHLRKTPQSSGPSQLPLPVKPSALCLRLLGIEML